MMKSKNLAAVFAIATTAAMMTATSAFAESRHRGETRGSNSSRQTNSSRGSGRVQRSDRSQSESFRSQAPPSRSQSYRGQSTYTQRFDNRSNSGRQSNAVYRSAAVRSDGFRNGGGISNGGSFRNDGVRGGRQTFEGHVTRIVPYGGGYRVWLDRGGYPFFIPEARFRLFPLRLGLSIRFGGYWDPLGYYNVYDVGPYGAGAYGYSTSGDLRGVVESVDYRRGTLVLRDDISGSFVTTVLRGSDPRLGDLRPGDSVDLGGSWNRIGVFEAFNVLDIRGGAGYDNRNDNRNYDNRNYDNPNDNPDGRY